MASPMADQILASVDAVERECGMNRILMEDTIIGTLVEFALGRLTVEEEASDEAGIVARVIPCNRDYAATSLHEQRRLNFIGPCDRCLMPNARAVARVWVPAGASIVSVEVCAHCRRDLDQRFTPIRWQR